MVKSYIKDTKRNGYYNLELLDLDTYQTATFENTLPKEMLSKILQGKIDVVVEEDIKFSFEEE